jgi:hypothetical protein
MSINNLLRLNLSALGILPSSVPSSVDETTVATIAEQSLVYVIERIQLCSR